jgi:hypothetical protein
MQIYKYPRTQHIERSRLQPGDEDLASAPFRAIAGRYLEVEEKLDGANAAISVGPDGRLLLQSRGHYLAGGPRERHFDLFKQWAQSHTAAFRGALGARYILYGEWLYAKHTIFYDRLPHYFLEFDVLDKEQNLFLSTERRRALLQGLPLCSVPLLRTGPVGAIGELTALLGRSCFIGPDHLAQLREICLDQGIDAEQAQRETDNSRDMEGLYIKVEEEGVVRERYKYVRHSFLTTVFSAENHWLDRPIIANRLLPGVDLWSSSPARGCA